jgi:hypothetical protein
MNRVTTLASFALLALPGLAFASPASAQTATTPAQPMQQGQPQAGMKPLVATQTAKMTATVEDIDQAKRTVLLRGEGGREAMITVGKEAKNFDQIKKGDRVTAEYLEATAIAVRKPGMPSPEPLAIGGPSGASAAGQPSATQLDVVEVAPPGQPPAGMQASITEITASVEDIDYGKRQVTLKGPLGNMRTIDIGPNVKDLDQVKKGDEIVIRHTEAVLLAVDRHN